MTKKHLLILFCILFFVVVIIVLNSTVFTLQNAKAVFVSYDGEGETIYVDAPEKYATLSAMTLVENFEGKNLFFLSSSKIIEQVHLKCPDLKVVAIRRIFPNIVEIFVTERQPVAYFEQNGYFYLVDSEMFVMEVSSSLDYQNRYIRLDISALLVSSQEVGKKVAFLEASKVELISDTFTAIWRTKFENVEMPNLLTNISFDTYKNIESMVLHTKTGAKIWLIGESTAENSTFQKLQSGLAVYGENSHGDNTKEGVNIYCYDPDAKNVVVG